MPKYDFVCPDHGLQELSMSFEKFDTFDRKCRISGCRKKMTRDYSDRPPVATFYDNVFTRRSTDDRQNRNIDHHDPRNKEVYPGNPNKKLPRELL